MCMDMGMDMGMDMSVWVCAWVVSGWWLRIVGSMPGTATDCVGLGSECSAPPSGSRGRQAGVISRIMPCGDCSHLAAW